MNMSRKLLLKIVLSLGMASAVTGCGKTDYALGAVIGQLRLLQAAVPIETALDDPNLTQEQRDKLFFVVRVRDYAEEDFGDLLLDWNLFVEECAQTFEGGLQDYRENLNGRNVIQYVMENSPALLADMIPETTPGDPLWTPCPAS